MSLTPGQQTFASVFSRETGLNPKVVGAWMLAEQSGSAAHFYESKGYNNWLNIARTDSGDAGGAHSQIWRNPVSAAKASAEWMKGQGQIAHEYGKPAGGIMGILHTAGRGINQQISAIANSGWASSGYNGGATLKQLVGQVGNVPSTPSVGPSKAIPSPVPGVPTSAPSSVPSGPSQSDAEGFKLLGKVFRESGGGAFPYQPKAQAPTEAPTQAIAKMPQAPSGGPSGYVNPHPGFTQEREDMGLDFAGKPGDSIKAVGDAKILGIAPDWYKGQPYVYYELENGPRKGQVLYVAEQIRPTVKVGQKVKAGEQIGVYANSGTGIEEGFGTHGTSTRAQATTGYSEGQRTKAGQEYAGFYRGLK